MLIDSSVLCHGRQAEDMKKRECQQPCCQLCKSLTIWKETETHCRAKQNISERHRDGPKWKDFRVQLPIPPFWEALSPGSPKTWVRNWDYTFKIFFLPTLPTIICLLMISWVEMLGLAKCSVLDGLLLSFYITFWKQFEVRNHTVP